MESSMSLRQKLLAGFGTVIVLMVVVVGLALVKIGEMRDQSDAMANSEYPKVLISNQVVERTLDAGLAMRSSLLTRDPAEKSRWLAREAADRTHIHTLLGQFGQGALDDSEQALIAAAQQAVQAVDGASVRLEPLALAAVDDTSRQAAVGNLNGSFIPANTALLDAMRALAKYETEQMTSSKQQSEALARSSYIELLAGLAVAFVIGWGLAYLLSGRFVAPLRRAMAMIGEIEDGNLAGEVEVPVESRDEALELQRHLAMMRVRLRELLLHIQQSAQEVSDSAHELSGMTQFVATSSQQQAAATSSAAATIEQLTVSINQVADSASEVDARAEQAGSFAHQGGEEAAQSATQIESVSEQVSATTERMHALSQQVNEIDSIVTVIKEVADQTNLLALNAAIEAARAGEAGRGFAVVADEVRKLAERTASSAQEITAMINSIQGGVGGAVEQMNGNLDSVREVSQRAEQAARTMQDIEARTGEVNQSIASINAALGEQRSASSDLAQRMEQMSQMSDSNSATVEELATTSSQLSSLSKDLHQLTARFTLA
jgi:methyl-accepting chemotaxis protein